MRRLILLSALGILAASAALAEELPFTGFLEVGAAARVVEDGSAEDDFLMAEARFQLDILEEAELGSLQFRTDVVRDAVAEQTDFDVREANIATTPHDSVDLKVGRQVLTWGTGDLVFLNDLFPKDWQSFFIGRDDEYLKKPSDAVRGTWFGDFLSIDMAWTPVFAPDGYISGERLSFWGGAGKVGPVDAGTPIDPDEPDKTLGNGEIAGRVYWDMGGWECALYGYRGRFGQPVGVDPGAGLYFPRLASTGASLRTSLLGGIANAEAAWYHSMDDKEGDNPLVANSEVRALVGFTREILPEQSLGLQLYLEHLLDWDSTTEDGGGLDRDENRAWLTARYMGLFMQQNLILSLFTFYSPTDTDAYLRPKITYKASDELIYTVGGNVFLGGGDDTFFGQFEDNTNLYARVRYSY